MVTAADGSRDLFPGALEMMILRTLRGQPLHGYALCQHIKRASDDLLQIEEGSLYPALQRLLKAELVSAQWGISATNRRVRSLSFPTTSSNLRLIASSSFMPRSLSHLTSYYNSYFLTTP